jgi:hypothetical protein
MDVYGPYLEFCRRHNLYDDLFEWNLEVLPLPFSTREFDVATAVEVIEHLEKEKGIALLNELERVARRVVVTTPNRFFAQAAYDGNDWQQHRSAWCAAELASRGYHVIGGGGLLFFGRKIRGFSPVLEGPARLVPRWAEYLLCVKCT